MEKITYDEAVACYENYLLDRGEQSKMSVEISGKLNRLSAIDAVRYLSDTPDLDGKLKLCKQLLLGNTVTITHSEAGQIASFAVTQGFEWFAVDEFDQNPVALKFLVNTIYGMFLKMSAPRLTSSTSVAEKKESLAQQQTVSQDYSNLQAKPQDKSESATPLV